MGLSGVGLSVGVGVELGVSLGEIDSIGLAEGDTDGIDLASLGDVVDSEAEEANPKKISPITIADFCQTFSSLNFTHNFLSNVFAPYSPVLLTPYSA
jgi:hypothetical protein